MNISLADLLTTKTVEDVYGFSNWRPIAQVKGSETVEYTRNRMIEDGIGSVLVSLENGQVAIWTEHDNLKLLHAKGCKNTPVGELATKKLHTVSPHDTTFSLVKALAPKVGRRHVVVMENNTPLAVFSSRRVLEYLIISAKDDPFFKMPCRIMIDQAVQQQRQRLIVDANETIDLVINLLLTHGGNGVRVRRDGKLRGIVTDRDILRAREIDLGVTVESLIPAGQQVVFFGLDDPISAVFAESIHGRFRHLPVDELYMLYHRDVFATICRLYGPTLDVHSMPCFSR